MSNDLYMSFLINNTHTRFKNQTVSELNELDI